MSADVLIVGAGMAGVSAALWARSLDLEPQLLECAPKLGGQLHHVHFHPEDFAGVSEGDGAAIAATLARQLVDAKIAPALDRVAVALEPAREDAWPAVRAADGGRITAPAIVVATGARRRHLEVRGEREFEGRGVSYSATRDRDGFAGQPVVVAGGGDAAYENALLLAEVGCRVTLVVRGRPRARAEFRRRVADSGAIEVIDHARVVEILGTERVVAVRIGTPDGDTVDRAAVAIVIKVGMLPNTEWCADAIALDAEGFVVVDRELRTTGARVWAAGDVTRPAPSSLAVAAGHGAQVMASIRSAIRPE